MAIRLGDVFVALRADSSGLDQDLNQAKGQVTGWANNVTNGIGSVMRGAFERVGHLATDFLVRGASTAIDFATESIGAASELGESINKVSVVFGDSADAILKWSETSAAALGQSRQQALEAAGTFGNLFDALGLSEEAATDMSVGLVELASDLASFNNIDPREALEKLRAGIVGETEPLRTLGVNLSAAAVEARVLELGLAATKSEITEVDKVTARYSIIMEQTANAQGDFARTSDGLANSQRILKAQWVDLQATVGNALLPVMTQVVSIMSDLASFVMPPLARFLETNVTPAFQQLADQLKALALNSSFEWTPDFKQVKLGDLFEFVRADGLGLTRIKIADWFDLTLGTEGIQKLKLGDFFDFINEAGATQINIGDYVTFIQAEGITSLTLKDFISFLDTEERTTVNIGEYVNFVYDKITGTVNLELEDVFRFTANEAGTIFNLADYVKFVYDNEAGLLTLHLGDVFVFDAAEGTKINLADYVVIEYAPDGEPVRIKIGDLYELDNTGGKKKVNIADVIDVQSDVSGSVTQIDLAQLFAFTTPISWNEILALGALPEITKLTFGNFFDFGGKEKITTSDVIDLSEAPAPPPKLTLNDFLDWVTGGEGNIVKLTFGDFFDFTADNKEGITKLTVGDFIAFNNGEEAKITWGDILSLSRDNLGITKLEIGDIINLEGEGLGGLFSDASRDLGKALEDAAATLTEALGAPQWVSDLVNWKPASGAPQWVTDLNKLRDSLVIEFAPGILETLLNFAPVIKLPSETELAPLLTMRVPTLPTDFWPTLPSFDFTSIKKLNLSDLFSFAEGDVFDLSSIFRFENPPVLDLSDLFPFFDGDRYSLSNLFSVGKLPSISLRDLFPFLGEGGTYDLGSAFNLDGLPSFDSLLAFEWPTPPQTISDLIAWAWPNLGEELRTDLTTLLAWVWPDVPEAITAILAWVWPDFDGGLSALLTSLIGWRWPELTQPAWLDSLLDFAWPSFSKPAWLDALLSFRWPSLPIPSWLGGGGASAPASTNTRSLPDSNAITAAATQPVAIYIGPNYVNNQADIELLAKRVGQRLAYGI